MQRDVLGHAEGRAADDAGDIGPVAMAVVRAIAIHDFGNAAANPAAELDIGCPDAGVDDVCVHARTALGIGVAMVERQEPFAGSVQAGHRIGLNGGQFVQLIRLDIFDAGIGAQRPQALGRNLDAEAVQRRLVFEQDRSAQGLDALTHAGRRGTRDALLEHHDILVRNSLALDAQDRRQAGLVGSLRGGGTKQGDRGKRNS